MAYKLFLKAVPDKEFQEHSELNKYYLDRFSLFSRLEKDNTHLYIIMYIKDKTYNCIYLLFESHNLHQEIRI